MAGPVWMLAFLAVWIMTPFVGERVVVFREFPGRVLVSLPYAFAVFAAVGMALVAGFNLARRRGKAGRYARVNSWLQWLALFPALGMLGLVQVPQLGSLLFIFASPCLLALAALQGFSAEPAGTRDRRGSDWLGLVAAGTVLFCLLGVWVTKTVGEHGGDEGHYLIQAQSLHDDGDLDLRNNLGDNPTPGDAANGHISPNSRHGRWYSFHISILPFLLAPTCGHGLYARHLVLGLIDGLGLAGVYLLARWLGASRRAGWAAALLMACSAFWGIYACRALPEVLGGTLAVYGFLSMLWLRSHPGRALLLATLCIGLLPWAYVRFIPLALALAGTYGIQCLCLPIAWHRRFGRLAAFSLPVLAVWTLYALNQNRMFISGMVHPVSAVFMASPSGLWGILTSSKGILVAFPIYLCALLGTIGLVRQPQYRMPALGALLCFLSIWLTSCSVPDWWGGGTLPGRFLLVTVPILMGLLAVVLDTAPAGFRFVALYLGLFSVNMFGFLLSVYPDVRGLFGPLVVGEFHFLVAPLPRFLPAPGETFPWLVVTAAVLLVFLWLAPRKPAALPFAVVIVMAGAFFWGGNPSDRANFHPLWTAQKWQRVPSGRAFMGGWGDTSRPLALLDYASVSGEGRWPRTVSEVTGTPAPQVNRGGVVSYPLITPNGWAPHPEYSWATLMDPFPAGQHEYALRLRARIVGSSDVELAVRAGGRTCVAKCFKAGTRVGEEFTFPVPDKTRLFVLMRFTDPAESNRFIVDELTVTPYQTPLARAGNLAVGGPLFQ